MNYNYDAIIFDLDGTIIDTERFWKQASQALLERRGIVLDKKTHDTLFTQLQGLALNKSCLMIKQTAHLPESVEELIAEKSEIAHSCYKKGLSFIPGFVEFHQKLSMLGLKSGIATNAIAESAELTDKILNLKRFFGQHIYNVNHVNFKNKPDPALYLFAANKLCVAPGRCIAIEDSAHGVRAAKQAGLYCIGINTAGKPNQLQEADCIVNGYQEIQLEQILGISKETPSIKPTLSVRPEERSS